MAWHAKKSASGSKTWMKCSGMLPLVASMDPSLLQPTGLAAMMGTCAHGLGEHCLNAGLEEVPQELMGTIIWLDSEENAQLLKRAEPQVETRSQLSAELGVDVLFFTRIDEKMRDGVQLYLDVVWEAYRELGDTVVMSVETRLDMSWLREGLGGTSDCTLLQFLGWLKAIDYKNGYVAVDADDNTQGMIYLLGEAHKAEWTFEHGEVIIVQPNSKDGHKVKRFTMTREELKAFEVRLGEASDRVDEAAAALMLVQDQVEFYEWAGTYLDAGTTEDHDHCTFCDALATCPAAIARAEAQAQADFADDPPDFNPLEIHDEDSLKRLTKVIKWGSYLDNLVKAAKTLGQRRLEQGLDMPGFKLVHGKANRLWPDTALVVKTLVEEGFNPDELYEEPKPPALKSPAQMEKIGAPRSKERKRAKELVGGVWDEEKQEWKTEPLAIKPFGKLTMAPDSDPREAVAPVNVADDFVDDLPSGDEE
jgi:hypothetical protein